MFPAANIIINPRSRPQVNCPTRDQRAQLLSDQRSVSRAGPPPVLAVPPGPPPAHTVSSVTHLDVGPVPLGGSLERQVGERRLFTSSKVKLEDVSGLGRDDADDGLAFSGDILRTEGHRHSLSS